MPTTPVYARPVSAPLQGARASSVYLLITLALGLTLLGVVCGVFLAPFILGRGLLFILMILELAIVWTSPQWSRTAPLNAILFALFPFFSGITLTPFLFSIAYGYVNGVLILMNACITTTLLTLASAVAASMAQRDLGVHYGFVAFQVLIGLLVFSLLQIFFPSLRGGILETMISGIGIALFALFLAIDLQRVARQAGAHSPFLLALTVYLDIYNLFLYVVRFMIAMSGDRR